MYPSNIYTYMYDDDDASAKNKSSILKCIYEGYENKKYENKK